MTLPARRLRRALLPAVLGAAAIAALLVVAWPGASRGDDALTRLYTGGQAAEVVRRAFAARPAGLDAYVLGRSFLARERWADAAGHLERALTAGAVPWRDHALAALGRARAKTGDTAGASAAWTEIAERHPDSIFWREAVQQAAWFAQRLKRHAAAAAWFTRAAGWSAGWDKSVYLFQAGEAFLALGRTNDAVARWTDVVALGQYGHYNNTALARLDKMPPAFVPGGADARLRRIRALINAALDARAQRELTALRPALVTRDHRLEGDTLQAWLFRRRYEYGRAELLLTGLLNTWAGDRAALLRVLSNLFYLQAARNLHEAAARTADQVHSIDPAQAQPLYVHLVENTTRDLARNWRFALLALARFPGTAELEQTLLDCVARTWSQRAWRLAGERAEQVALVAKSRLVVSGAAYFAARAHERLGRPEQAAAWARRAVLAAPLDFYHYRLHDGKKAPNLPYRGAPVPGPGASLPELCAAWFAVDPAARPALEARVRAGWPSAPLARLLDAYGDGPGGVDAFLPGHEQARFRFFHGAGLYREAYQEVYQRVQLAQRRVVDFPPAALLWISRLAEKGRLFNASLYFHDQLLARTGWGRELALLETLGLATPVRDIYPRHYLPLVQLYSLKNNLDPWFVLSLIRQESSFDAEIISWAGAVGLMQVMPSTGREIAARLSIKPMDLQDPEQNVRIGTSFAGWLKYAYKTDYVVLMGYNAGPGRFGQWSGSYRARYGHFDHDGFLEYVPFAETRDYVKRVLANYGVYRFLHAGWLR